MSSDFDRFRLSASIAIVGAILASCASEVAPVKTGCINAVLEKVSDNKELLFADRRAFAVLGQDFIDPATWKANDPVTICPRAIEHVGAPIFEISNKRLLEELVVSERNGEQ